MNILLMEEGSEGCLNRLPSQFLAGISGPYCKRILTIVDKETVLQRQSIGVAFIGNLKEDILTVDGGRFVSIGDLVDGGTKGHDCVVNASSCEAHSSGDSLENAHAALARRSRPPPEGTNFSIMMLQLSNACKEIILTTVKQSVAPRNRHLSPHRSGRYGM
jgi:hypothetical protein